MIQTAFDQMRFIMSLAFGVSFAPRSIERLVAAARATRDEFGTIGQDGAELISGITLDAESMRDAQTRGLRAAAKRANETAFYSRLFKQLGIDPAKLTLADLSCIPITTKNAVRDDPDAFVRSRPTPPRPIDSPILRATTTGTTGTPTSIYFSQREMRAYAALWALGMVSEGTIDSSDIIQMSTNARGLLGNLTLMGGAAHVGALVYQTGIIAPESALRFLTEAHSLSGKKARTSILYTYPSYLGSMVETGLAAGLSPSDFGLKRIAIGGEVVSEGLQRRARELFGEVIFEVGYGITELWGMNSRNLSDGLDFQVGGGLIEVLDPNTGLPSQPGQIGTLVGTPFPPYRETTMLLRYDTEDLVRALDASAGTQRCGSVLGKKRLAVRHDDGSWTTPHDIIEVLESCDDVPLPARFSIYEYDGGVGVDVMTYTQDDLLRRRLANALEDAGIPVHRLTLCASPLEFSHAIYPLRGDLRETMFEYRAGIR